MRYASLPLFRYANRLSQLKYNAEHPEKAAADSKRMKQLLEEYPKKSVQGRLRRSRKTSIEKLTQALLNKMGLLWVWNAPVRTMIGTKFPDFIVFHLPQIAIQCDGKKFHNQEEDLEWDKAILAAGYSVLRFSEEEINKNRKLLRDLIQEAMKSSCLMYRSYWAFGEHSQNIVMI